MKYSWYKIAAVSLALIGVGVTVWNKLNFNTGETSRGTRKKRRLSNAGRAFLEREEGKRNSVYTDSKGFATIGIGHLVLPGESFGTLSDTEVYELLNRDLVRFENAVNEAITVPISQNQFDALVSFAFNLGPGWVTGKGKPQASFIKLINQKASKDDIFNSWTSNFTEGGLLKNRRIREATLFING